MRIHFKYIIIPILLCLPLLGIKAQQSEAELRQIFLKAESEYNIGRFSSSMNLLNGSVKKFDSVLKTEAYRLLTLCSLAQDRAQEAENYAQLLLKENPYYTISLRDPSRFVDLIDRLKNGQVTITTASQQAETLDEAPVPVTLITEEMIEASGARNLTDLLLLYVPGMSLIEGNEMNVAMHGAYSSTQEKILIMLDGHRLNSRSTNSEAPDFRHSLDKIKQIEVLRGPSSSLYGNVALTAVVNIITKKGYEVNGMKTSVGIGTNHTYQADLLFGKAGVNLDILAWASIYTSKGERRELAANDEDNFGMILQPGYMYIGGYNHKPSYDIGVKVGWEKFKFLFNMQHSKKVMPYNTVLFPSLYSYDRYRKIEGSLPGHSRQSYHGEISYENAKEKWATKISAYFDYDKNVNYDVIGDTVLADYRVLPVSPGEVLPLQKYDTLLDYGAYQVQDWSDYTYGGIASASYHFTKEKLKGTLLFGTQYEHYQMQDNSVLVGDHYSRIIVTYSTENQALIDGSEDNISLFTQLKLNIGNKFSFNGGLRYDHKIRFDSRKLNAFSPRISMIYRYNPDTYLKFCYAHSFVDAPYFYRASTIATYSGGSSLESETMDAVQINFNRSLPQWNLKYELNAYYNALSDLVYYDAEKETDMYSNAGSLKLLGIEGCVSHSTERSLLNLNVCYQHLLDFNNYAAHGSKLYNVSNFMLNTTFNYTALKHSIYGKLSPWLNLSLSGKQLAPYNDPYIFKGSEVYNKMDNETDFRVLMNLGVNYRMNRWNAVLGFYNIFNTHYYQGGSNTQPLPQQGFNMMMKISYTL